jgi:hypothetical protein
MLAEQTLHYRRGCHAARHGCGALLAGTAQQYQTTPTDIKKELAMSTCGEKASLQAVALIEEQLRTLPVSIAAILEAFDVDEAEAALLENLALSCKPRHIRTGSGGNIVAAEAQPHPPVNFQALTRLLSEKPFRRLDHFRVLAGNALLAIGFFLHKHEMLSMRTPEVQFLGHAVNAVLNGNTLNVNAGYMPTAAFDGLVIDAAVDGKPLFDTAEAEGLMAIGDAIALLQWLSRYFRGEDGYVSGGDAG